METVLAFHKNTDNTHFHFSFFEKVPTKWNGNEKEFRKMGKLDKNSIRDLELNITHSIKTTKQTFDDLFKSKDNVREQYNLNLLDYKKVFDDLVNSTQLPNKVINKLSNKIKKISSENFNLTFGSKKLSHKTRKEIVNLTYTFIDSVPELKSSFDEFQKENTVYAKQEFKRFLKTYKNEYSEIDNIKNFDLTNEEKGWDYNFNLDDEKEFLKFKKISFLIKIF
ncbi:hypothetical protein EMELA_v1c03580 [Mesoplasma melaleucae]|uniref:Uncharacterized protein n=1 Tax=Mesoplasma melaleucae TaxID=81459 RepID=A0A2K8NVQ5_9MOLU|nr:hypothetical protein EMELA_v1c03580 [Mesoplasma melaleucae]